METPSKEIEEVVRTIGTLKSVKDLEAYKQSLPPILANNGKLESLINKRILMFKK